MEWKAKYSTPMLCLLSAFDVATSALLILYPIVSPVVLVCVCLVCSTEEPGAEAFLNALFEELALRQKSGKEVKWSIFNWAWYFKKIHNLYCLFACLFVSWKDVRCVFAFCRKILKVLLIKWSVSWYQDSTPLLPILSPVLAQSCTTHWCYPQNAVFSTSCLCFKSKIVYSNFIQTNYKKRTIIILNRIVRFFCQ